MAELVAWSGSDPQKRWRRTLQPGPVTLGRKAELSAWDVPWDRQISGRHATLTWADGKLVVRKEARAINRIYFRGTPADEFTMAVGDQFVIGNTTFALQDEAESTPSEPAPQLELTCSRQELERVKYIDADERIDVLSALPGMIRYSPSDEDFEKRVLEALLQGIPRADAAAIVCAEAGADGKDDIVLRRQLRRDGQPANIQFSRRLITNALRRRRQSVLHCWGADQGADSSISFTVNMSFNWAICAPLPDEPAPGWGLYVTGRNREDINRLTTQDREKNDLKFAELVADIFGSLRQVRDLQKRQTMLERFFSRPVLAALAERDIDEVLRPKQTDVTVLMCDLRGSCRIAEDADRELPDIWKRVGEALCIMTTNIIDKDGVIGDFQGDAAMGFWGWPLDSGSQVEQAARAALGIRRDFLRAAQQPGHPLYGFSCGIGIAHGSAFAGRLGTLDQFKVGVFGPVVNLAARLESMTKYFKVPILLDDNAARALDNPRHHFWSRCRRLAKLRPYGMNRTVQVSELLPPAVEPSTLAERDRRDYEAALDAFQSGRWNDAQELLDHLPSDGPSEVLQVIMEKHAHTPPPAWDGVIVLESK